MTQAEILRRSVFPNDALPGFFSGDSIAEWLAEQDPWFLDRKNPKHNPQASLTPVSMPRMTHTRRMFAVQNPFPGYVLACEIADSIQTINEKMNPQGFSLTVPTWGEWDGGGSKYYRAQFSFEESMEVRLDRQSFFEFELQADVTRFYPSIYTHSIAWAVEGKPRAKRERTNYDLLGNRLDRAVQNCQDGQTNGIPIGPQTSTFLAELVMGPADTSVHAELADDDSVTYAATRAIDDFSIYTWDESAALRARKALHRALSEYNLEIHPEKTMIRRLPSQPAPGWLLRMNSMPLDAKDDRSQRKQILHLFSLARELAPKTPIMSVMKRFNSRLHEAAPTIVENNIPLVHDLALKSMAADSRATPAVVRLLAETKEAGHEIGEGTLDFAVRSLLYRSRSQMYTYEAVWPLTLNLLHSGSLSNGALDVAESIADPFIACLVMRHHELGITDRIPITDRWEALLDDDNPLDGPNWFLAYEAERRGWWRVRETEDHDFFGRAMDAGVTFLSDDHPDVMLEEFY